MTPDKKNDIYQVVKIIFGVMAGLYFAWRIETIIFLLR